MILVDIYIAGAAQKYDFWLDETAYISDVADEIGEMLSRREENREVTENRYFFLCSYDQKRILPSEKTLDECGVCNGSRLLFL